MKRLIDRLQPAFASAVAFVRNDVKVERDFLDLHKRVVTGLVMPFLSVMTFAFIALYLSTDPKVIAGMSVVVIAAGLNIFLTSKNRTLSLGKIRIESRSDGADLFRWFVNFLVLDPTLMILVHPADATTFAAAWTTFMIGALVDTFGKGHRFAVILVASASGAACLKWLYPGLEVRGIGFSVLCMMLVIAAMWVMEGFWVKSMARTRELQRRELETEMAAYRFRMEAAVGANTKMLIHELSNSIMIIDLHAEAGNGEAVEAIRRSVSYVKRLNGLILDGHSTKAELRQYTVSELMVDFEMLLKNYCRMNGTTASFKVEDDVGALSFEERNGALYFISHNIVKNACEALRDAGKTATRQAQIVVTARRNGDHIVLSISDNGPGMPQTIKDAILAGKGISGKKDGHGIGMKFVREECSRSGFTLEIKVRPGSGTEFEIWLPIVGTAAHTASVEAHRLATRALAGGGLMPESTDTSPPAPTIAA